MCPILRPLVEGGLPTSGWGQGWVEGEIVNSIANYL